MENHLRRNWIQIAALGLSTTLSGCGAGSGSVEPYYPTTFGFAGWDSLSADSCWGSIGSFGVYAAPTSSVRLQLWYATAQRETVRVVRGAFVAPAQITRGEPRYPRVGAATWDGGSSPAEPRAPVIMIPRPNWCWINPDTMEVRILNNVGGWAYHVTVTIENRDGIQNLPTAPDRLERNRTGYLRSVPLNSYGTVAPRLLKVRWEDYGGIRDSLVSPSMDPYIERCY